MADDDTFRQAAADKEDKKKGESNSKYLIRKSLKVKDRTTHAVSSSSITSEGFFVQDETNIHIRLFINNANAITYVNNFEVKATYKRMMKRL